MVAFTAAQIPGIAGRRYPPSLAGPFYPQGIPIVPESALESLAPERVVFAYSDVSHEAVMHLASRALAAGADFELLGPQRRTARIRTHESCARPCLCGSRATWQGGGFWWSRTAPR